MADDPQDRAEEEIADLLRKEHAFLRVMSLNLRKTLVESSEGLDLTKHRRGLADLHFKSVEIPSGATIKQDVRLIRSSLVPTIEYSPQVHIHIEQTGLSRLYRKAASALRHLGETTGKGDVQDFEVVDDDDSELMEGAVRYLEALNERIGRFSSDLSARLDASDSLF